MYWNPMKWSLSHIPTSPKDWWVPMPVGMLLMTMMGGLFVVFLPLIGFVLTIHALAKLAARPAQAVLARLATPHPVAGAAYLTGRPTEGGKPAKSSKLDEVERLVRERRQA
jgi:hypothetical protein